MARARGDLAGVAFGVLRLGERTHSAAPGFDDDLHGGGTVCGEPGLHTRTGSEAHETGSCQRRRFGLLTDDAARVARVWRPARRESTLKWSLRAWRSPSALLRSWRFS
jgi:hypothetical protein